MAGAEGSEGTLGSHGAAYQPMVQAERTGLNPYFPTKSLETNCKLEDLTRSSPKASIWPIPPSSQTWL